MLIIIAGTWLWRYSWWRTIWPNGQAYRGQSTGPRSSRRCWWRVRSVFRWLIALFLFYYGVLGNIFSKTPGERRLSFGHNNRGAGISFFFADFKPWFICDTHNHGYYFIYTHSKALHSVVSIFTLMPVFHFDAAWYEAAFENLFHFNSFVYRPPKKQENKTKDKKNLDTASCRFLLIRMFGMHILEVFILGFRTRSSS